MCDGIIPTDSTEFIYCFASVPLTNQIYIGDTICLYQILIQHNSGNVSQGTKDIRNKPWEVVAYICGLLHMTKNE